LKIDLVASNPKLVRIQNEIKQILIDDEAQSDEESLGFPSLGIAIKPPTIKTQVNEEMWGLVKLFKTNWFDARLINKFSEENPLFSIMSYLYNSLGF